MAHAEGKFVVRDEATLESLQASGRLVLRYAAIGEPVLAGASAAMQPSVPYPDNPNGACGDVAGICDTTGRVLGLMPHPERFIFAHQHPQSTRLGVSGEGAGMQIFRNAVEYFVG